MRHLLIERMLFLQNYLKKFNFIIVIPGVEGLK